MFFRILQGLDKEWPDLLALVTHHTVMPEMLPCTLRLPHKSKNPTYKDNDKDEKDEDPDYQRLSDFTSMMEALKKWLCVESLFCDIYYTCFIVQRSTFFRHGVNFLGCHGNITLVRVIKLSLWFCKMKIHVFLWQTIDKIKAIFSFLSMCNANKLYSWKLARIKMLITSMWLNYSVTIATVLNFENPNVFNDNSAS